MLISQTVDTAYYYTHIHTHYVLLYCCKRHTLDNCLSHNHFLSSLVCVTRTAE